MTIFDEVDISTSTVPMSLPGRRRPSFASSSDSDSDDELLQQRVHLGVDQEWQDAEPDEESVIAVSLFEDKRFSGVDAVKQVIEYDAERHGCDLRDVIRRLGRYAYHIIALSPDISRPEANQSTQTLTSSLS